MSNPHNNEDRLKWRWSSTEYTSMFAWVHYFTTGYRNFDNKTSSDLVQAVRRVKK